MVDSIQKGVAPPDFADIKIGDTSNSYRDSYGVRFGKDEGFTYDTSITSEMIFINTSICMRVSAKSTT